MKQIYSHIKLAAVSLLIFSACTQDEMLPQIGENETASIAPPSISLQRRNDRNHLRQQLLLAAEHAGQRPETISEPGIRQIAEELRGAGHQKFRRLPHRVGHQQAEEIELLPLHHTVHFGAKFLLPLME